MVQIFLHVKEVNWCSEGEASFRAYDGREQCCGITRAPGTGKERSPDDNAD